VLSKIKEINQVWWYMSVIQAVREVDAEEFQVQRQHS
jgi:hypothetical protein